MRDYASLPNELRVCSKNSVCELCDILETCLSHEKTTIERAADAIEELLAERDQYKAYFDNVSSLPDCNVCLKQSVCEFVPAWGENTRINCPLVLTEPPKEVE